MIKLTGSWVAMPTPFDKDNKVDFGAFKLLDVYKRQRPG